MKNSEALEKLGATVSRITRDVPVETKSKAGHKGYGKIKKHVTIDLPSADVLVKFPRYGSDRRAFVFGSHIKTPEENAKAIVNGAAPEALFEQYLSIRGTLQPLIDKYAGMGTSTKRRRVRREEGSELDIDRAMTGDPQCWELRVRGKRKKVVRLAVQYSYTGSADEATFVRAATMAAAASDILTRLGYAVEIVGVYWAYFAGSGTEFVMTVPLKDADAPFDPRRVLITGLPAMQRLFTWGLMEKFFVQDAGDAYRPEMSDTAREHLNISALIGATLDPSDLSFDPALEGFVTDMQELI